jgi:hypothetical protein
MFKRVVLGVLFFVAIGAVWAPARAQEPADSAGGYGAKLVQEAAAESAAPAGELAESTGPAPLPGDVITLKSGKKLTGVQVLRELPNVVEIEIQPGMEALKLPRKQVQSIQYDDIDPIKQKRLQAMQPPPAAPDVIPGEELSQEFNQKLKAPLSDAVMTFQDIGVMKLMMQLSEQVGVELQVEESAKQLPADQRVRSFEIKPGTSLFTFLQTDFLAAYPALKVLYKYDKIVLTGADAPAPAG